MGTARYVPHHDVLDLDTVGHFIVGLVDTYGRTDTMSTMAATKQGRRPRRQFDDDFRAQAVRLVLDEGKT